MIIDTINHFRLSIMTSLARLCDKKSNSRHQTFSAGGRGHLGTRLPTTLLPLLRMAVCVGEYPTFLTDAWDDYDLQYKSENDKPGTV